MYHIFRKEGRPEKHVDTLTIYMVVATILGARLGHVIFYQPELFVSEPWSILLPFEFSPFKFTGLQGLASHGAAFGILFALWLFARKKVHQMNYIQILDRIVIVVALTGGLIRLGNFFNSEIIGKPSDNPLSVVFVNRVTEGLLEYRKESNTAEIIKVEKNEDLPPGAHGRVPITMYVFFKPGTTDDAASGFLNGDMKYFLTYYNEYVDEPATEQLKYQITREASGTLAAKVSTFGVSRHPAQLYEAISCFILFAILFLIWNKDKEKITEGKIFGIFMIILWSLRFAYEFLKENQVSFEDQLPINMGQILSIPLIAVGIIILIWSYRKSSAYNKKPS